MSNNYGELGWSVGNYGQQGNATVAVTGLSAVSTSVGSAVAEGTVEAGWGRRQWGEQVWGDAFTVELTGVSSTFTLEDVGRTGTALINPTGVSSGAVLGTAIGEPESIYPLTGVQSATSTGTVSISEGHGVQPTGIEMVFADGTETIITTTDAGWGRNTWGSFAWNENITQNVSVTGEQLTVGQSGVDIFTGTGVIATPTGLGMSTGSGTFTFILSVTTSAPPDLMDTALGSVEIDIFTQVDVTSLVSTFETGTLVAPAAALPTGEEIQTNIGDVVIPITVAGLSMAFTDGTATTTAGATVLPTGVEMIASVGNMRSTPWANVVTGASNTWTKVAA
jgi:hypothetical protein